MKGNPKDEELNGMVSSTFPKILYGGDYNPEQWPEQIWEEDMRLFKLADIDIVTLNVFSWAYNQPDEHTYRFDVLDKIMDKCAENNIKVCLGTGTAAHPAWMAKKYPDILAVDYMGNKRKFGRRHNSCPNSPTFRKYAGLMARKLAERYKDHPALFMWHVNNEMGIRCYCDNCEKAFREWLKRKYGTIDKLNEAWYTRFWGHTFYDWDEIVLPSGLSEGLDKSNPDKTAFQGISLDFYRFNSDSLLECYLIEYRAIKDVIPDAIVTTNFHSNGIYKPLDYHKWAKYMDIIALDMYPDPDAPASAMAMRYDFMRGLKGGDPWMLMESCPGPLNWKAINPLKDPGVMRLWSYQAISRGAESVMFFQMRRSRGAYENFHGAVIDHEGSEKPRVFRECAELGKELTRLGDRLLTARTPAKAAIVFDWENWWAVEFVSAFNNKVSYLHQIQLYYQAFFQNRIDVDFVSVEDDLDKYDIVVAPMLHMIKPGYAQKLEVYVEQGGIFLTTFFSGIVDENALVITGGFPGPLRKLTGVWVEEIDAMQPNERNSIQLSARFGDLEAEYPCTFAAEIIHPETAETIAVYGADFYKGTPVVTRNRFGKGEAWYIGTEPAPAFVNGLIGHLCKSKGIEPVADQVPAEVEVTRRVKDGKTYTFYLNHGDQSVAVNLGQAERLELLTGRRLSGEQELAAKGVWILTDAE